MQNQANAIFFNTYQVKTALLLSTNWYYDYLLNKTWREFGDQVLTFNLSSCQLAPFSSGNLSAINVISSKPREIAGDDNVTLEMQTVAHGNTIILSPRLRHLSSFAPDPIDIQYRSYYFQLSPQDLSAGRPLFSLFLLLPNWFPKLACQI